MWRQVFEGYRAYGDSPFRIGHEFTSPLLIVEVSSTAAQPSWRRAGTLFPIIEAPGAGVVEGVGRWAYLRPKVLKFESIGLSFDLEFRSVGWLPHLILSIWEPEQPITEVSRQEFLEALQELDKKLEGEELILTNASYQEIDDSGETLYQSTFVVPTKYANYEVGRFKRTDTGSSLSDPIIIPRPYQLMVTFTNKEKIPPNVVTVLLSQKL